MDILYFGRKLPFRDVRRIHGFCQLSTTTVFWLTNWLSWLSVNCQRQQAPLKGCACSCLLQLTISTTLARRPICVRPATSYLMLLVRVSADGYFSQRRDISIVRKTIRRAGAARANTDGPRARMRIGRLDEERGCPAAMPYRGASGAATSRQSRLGERARDDPMTRRPKGSARRQSRRSICGARWYTTL